MTAEERAKELENLIREFMKDNDDWDEYADLPDDVVFDVQIPIGIIRRMAAALKSSELKA